MDRRDYFEKLQAQGFEIPTGAIIDPPRGGFPNMPNLQGIGGIPGLQNIDFSNLPMGMDFSNFDPRAINANPQGFQDMIEQAQAQEGRVTSLPVLGNTPRGPGMSLREYATSQRLNPLPSFVDNILPQMPSADTLGGPMEYSDARRRAIKTGTPMPNMEDYDMSALGPRIGNDQTLPMPQAPTGQITDMLMRNPDGSPMTGNLPPSMGLNPPPSGFEGSTTMPVRNPDGTTIGSSSLPQAPVQTTAPVQPTAPVQQPLAPYTGGNDPAPYVSNQLRNETGLDALSQQLLFGLDGKGGFIPGAMQAAETSFFNPDGTPRVVEQQVAGLTDDQQRAMEMARGATGIQDQYLDDAQSAFRSSVGELGSGLDRAKQRELESLGVIQSGVGSLNRELSDVENIQRGAVGNFGTQLGSLAGRSVGATDEFGNKLSGLEGRSVGATDQFGNKLSDLSGRSIGATDQFGNRLGESENLLRGALGGYDQSLTSQFYNPYEDRVVQQTIDDVFKAGEKQDMAQRARDIQTGGESAFGSRARLSAEERREALGRGLGQSLGSLRAQGFGQAQSTGLNEFARQRAQEMATSQGLSGLAGSRLGSQQNLTNQLSGFAGQQLGSQQDLTNQLSGFAGSKLGAQQNLTNQLSGFAGQQLGAQQGLASNLGALAGTRFGAQQTQAGALSNLGNLEAQMGQQRAQAQQNLGSNLQNIGNQAQQASAFDINQLMGAGQMQQQQQQAQLDATRANQLQAQQAPLAQYQSLLPFMQSVPTGSFQTSTTFAPKPSALQSGLGVGLSTLGALGNFFNQPQGQQQQRSNAGYTI